MDVHLRGGSLQSGSHEKPGPSCRLRSPRPTVYALVGRNAVTKSFTNSDHSKGIEPLSLIFPHPARIVPYATAFARRSIACVALLVVPYLAYATVHQIPKWP